MMEKVAFGLAACTFQDILLVHEYALLEVFIVDLGTTFFRLESIFVGNFPVHVLVARPRLIVDVAVSISAR